MEPLSRSDINSKKFLRCNKEINLADLHEDVCDRETRKGYIDLQIIRMIANGKNNQYQQVRYYKSKDTKKVSTVGYKRLFLLRVIRTDVAVSNLVYILEDNINHINLWNHFTSIRDNGGITIGTIIRFFKPKPYENIMPDGNPSIESRFPVAIMKQPTHYLEVKIDYKISGGQSKSFCFNECSIYSLSISAEESGCAGLFCDKQRVLEVRKYNQGCCCYSYDSRRTNVIIDHSLEINNRGFQEENGTIKIENFSSVQFSLLYQTSVFCSQIRQSALELTDAYFEVEDCIENVLDLINENGGFTVIGWYKRGNISDRTILHQKNYNENSKSNSNDQSTTEQIDNSTITYHPCVIKPTNPDFFTEGTPLFIELQNMKYDSNNLMNSM